MNLGSFGIIGVGPRQSEPFLEILRTRGMAMIFSPVILSSAPLPEEATVWIWSYSDDWPRSAQLLGHSWSGSTDFAASSLPVGVSFVSIPHAVLCYLSLFSKSLTYIYPSERLTPLT